jgi:hypothetical protein
VNIRYIKSLIKDSPMHYFVVDLTGRHTPSTKALGNLYDEIQKQMNSKVEYKRYNVGITEENILLGKVVF